jgi:hypothetical protein
MKGKLAAIAAFASVVLGVFAYAASASPAAVVRWPSAVGGGSGSAVNNAVPAVAWYSLDDTNSLSHTVNSINIAAKLVQSGNPGLNEIYDSSNLFSWSSDSEICYSGGQSTFLLSGSLTAHVGAGGAQIVFATFAVNESMISSYAGGADDDWSLARHSGTNTVGASSEIPLQISQVATLAPNDCVEIYAGCSTANCSLSLWAGSIVITELTPKQGEMHGLASISSAAGTPYAVTTDDSTGGVIVKSLNAALSVQLGAEDCTEGKSVTVVDQRGNGAITIEIPNGYQVEELTDATGDNIASTGAYGESISLLCTGLDVNGNGDLDISVTGLKGSWVDAN